MVIVIQFVTMGYSLATHRDGGQQHSDEEGFTNVPLSPPLLSRGGGGRNGACLSHHHDCRSTVVISYPPLTL